MGSYLRGSIDESLALSTLGPKVVISTPFTAVVDNLTRCSSVVCWWSLDQFTPGGDDGPILVGLAHSDYTAPEIEEWIENTGSWNKSDLVQSREVAKRLVRRIGVFETPVTVSTQFLVLNDGKPIKTKLNWLLSEGQTLKLWAYNMGASSLATTNPNVKLTGHANTEVLCDAVTARLTGEASTDDEGEGKGLRKRTGERGSSLPNPRASLRRVMMQECGGYKYPQHLILHKVKTKYPRTT